MAATTTIRPQPGPQETWLRSPADIAIYGGAAGGGKTWALLAEPLRHVANPAFTTVIFRRTSPQIRNPGGLWDESQQLYRLLGATPREQYLDWTFPTGATIQFAHLQYDSNVYDWQGAQIALIGFDELTHFSERQFFYLLSRNRSTCGVRPYVRATTNPDADSWVASFISWWIDQETGLAIAERAGVLRWFVRVGDVLHWADSADELRQQFPKIEPKSATFVPASVYDNQVLLAKDPGYLANLMAQSLVERERLLNGNWKIKPAAGKVFNRSWFGIVEALPAGCEFCRFWDFAATEKQLAGDDPDYTAGILVAKAPDGTFYIVDCIAVQVGPAEVDKLFLATSRQDASRYAPIGRYRVRWEIEPGSAGKRESVRLVKLLAGLDAKGVHPQGDKITRARGLAAQSEAGNVKLLRGAWNEGWLHHMHHQPDHPHDDIMDGSSGGFNDLARPVRTLRSQQG